MLSDKIKSDCTVETGCDCCITDLFFLSDKEFVLIGNCEGGGSYFSGTYLKVNKKVTLTFKPFYVSQESDYLIENRKIEKKEIKINPMEFDLTTCGPKLETIENFKIKDRNG